MNILYISNSIPYDSIRHAGGKTLNYYVKKINKYNCNNVKVIGICKEEELPAIDGKKYGLDIRCVITKGSVKRNVIRIITDLFGILSFRVSLFESYYKTFHILRETLRLKQDGFMPDVIFLEWTNMVMLAKQIKEIYPNSKLVASECDVAFLGTEREYRSARGIKRAYLYRKHEYVKNGELSALQICDVAMPQNIKDKLLLIEHGVPKEKIFVLTPYFHNMSYIKRRVPNKDILFWGAMDRPMNDEAAHWFIDNVMPKLSDLDIRFVVAGNRPSEELQAKANDRIIVTGFVEDETPLFCKSMCSVSPLLNGAGVKIKVIESLSAGIPILTNEIGIEGIPAENGKSYLLCKTPQDYADVIHKIYNHEIDLGALEKEQRKVISQYYDLNKGFTDYYEMLCSLADSIKNSVKEKRT